MNPSPSATERLYLLLIRSFTALFLTVLAFVPAQAAPGNNETRDWLFEGSELMAALEGKPSGKALNGEAGAAPSSARAAAYIAGVADAASGTQWCGAGSVLPHELSDRIYTYLKTLSPERLKGNAGPLVMEGLAATFPCSATD